MRHSLVMLATSLLPQVTQVSRGRNSLPLGTLPADRRLRRRINDGVAERRLIRRGKIGEGEMALLAPLLDLTFGGGCLRRIEAGIAADVDLCGRCEGAA